MIFSRPKIVVSKCLGFAECRYNGVTIENENVSLLKEYVDFVTVCPEVGIGLGAPRNPIRLVKEKGKTILYQPATGERFTKEMENYSDDFLSSHSEVDGFILKDRSPTCGPSSVKVYEGIDNYVNRRNGVGLFAEKIFEKFKLIPVEDEGRLRNFSIRENFFVKIFLLARFREVVSSGEIKNLIDFHTDNKLLFLAYNPSKLKELGQLLANQKDYDFSVLIKKYKEILLELVDKDPTFNKWINVLEHAFGGVSKDLSSEEIKFFKNSLEEYRDERIPLSNLINLIKSWAIRFKNEYLLSQTFLEPFPKDLVKVTDSGKGR